jgi:hypothetical protein
MKPAEPNFSLQLILLAKLSSALMNARRKSAKIKGKARLHRMMILLHFVESVVKID